MNLSADEILAILDTCSDNFTFPMLDNGYVYLAATRLSLFRSTADWALVIEVFGFSPRAGLPDTHIYTLASRLYNRTSRDQFLTQDAYHQHLVNNQNNESNFVYPIAQGEWLDLDDSESLASHASEMAIRNNLIRLPSIEQYQTCGIELEEPPNVFVYEVCRYLAHTHRDLVLATEAERRFNVPPELEQILVLDEWNHPDVITTKPSESETFQQLAKVLSSGNIDLYKPTMPPNTHWKNWPEGGTL